MKLLFSVIKNRYINAIKLLIKPPKSDVNIADQYGDTPLLRAIKNGYTEMVKALIAANADVNIADQYDRTPLLCAIDNGHTEIVKALIAANADVNIADHYDRTPLLCAVFYGYTEIVEVLIAANADVNIAGQYDRTPLLCAVFYGYTEIVEVLIAANADVNITDQDGDTPLLCAIKNGYTEMVKALIARDPIIKYVCKETLSHSDIKYIIDLSHNIPLLKHVLDIIQEYGGEDVTNPLETYHQLYNDINSQFLRITRVCNNMQINNIDEPGTSLHDLLPELIAHITSFLKLEDVNMSGASYEPFEYSS